MDLSETIRWLAQLILAGVAVLGTASRRSESWTTTMFVHPSPGRRPDCSTDGGVARDDQVGTFAS